MLQNEQKPCRKWNDDKNVAETPARPQTKELLLNRYKQAPQDRLEAYAKGFLVCPMSEIPSAESGFKRELDELRLQLQCHIIYDKDLQAFKIFSAGKEGIKPEEAVKTALIHVRKKVLHKGRSHGDIFKVFLAHLPEDHTLRLVREFATSHDLLQGDSFEKHHAVFQLKRVKGAHVPDNWPAWSAKLQSTQVDVFRFTMQDRIAELHSIDETVHMRARTGICVFKNYLWESNKIRDVPISAIVDSFENGKTDAVLCSLNNDAQLLQHTMKRNVSLGSTDLLRCIGVESLAHFKPTYEILFDVAGQGQTKATHQLHVSASQEQGSTTIERNWRKFIDRDRVGRALEIFMVKFSAQQSWKLQVDATPRVSIPGDQERNFAASVRLKDHDTNINSPPGSRLRFDFTPNNNIHFIRQKTIWRAVLRSDQRWVVEIAKYDQFARSNPYQGWTAVDNSRWDVSIYHRSWNMLSRLNNDQDPDQMLGALLSPEEENPAVKEAIKGFCQKMNEVSDSLSFWPRSVE